MQFLLMCAFDDERWAALAEEHRARIMHDYDLWVREQVTGGRYVTGGKLTGSTTAATIRERDGKPLVVDGPFAEAREQIGGYHVVECRDRDEAVAMAQTIPTLPAGGTVEVRPVLKSLGS